MDTNNCIVCTALKEKFKGCRVSAGGSHVTINWVDYYFGSDAFVGGKYEGDAISKINRVYEGKQKLPLTITVKGLKEPETK